MRHHGDASLKVTKQYLESNEPFLGDGNGSKFNPYYDGKASGKDIADFLGWPEKKDLVSANRPKK